MSSRACGLCRYCRVTLVNVNTARAEVIAARVPDLSLEQAKALVAQRDAGMWFATEAISPTG